MSFNQENEFDFSLDIDPDEILGLKDHPTPTQPTIDPPSVKQQKPLPSLNDLPKLSSTFKSNRVEWGPNMKKPAPITTPTTSLSSLPSISSTNASSLSGSSTVTANTPVASKNIQEIFTIDLQSQLSITKQEYSKIIQNVKQSNNNVSIESTLSKNSRTFLISGKRADVISARRDLVKKLTKPVEQTFTIPSNCTRLIIGAGGKTIREISDSTDTKINIAKEVNKDSYDEELSDTTTNVTVFGDIESVNLAKLRIMQIVKEDIKNAVLKINVDDSNILPFISVEQFVSNDVSVTLTDSQIVVSGIRDDVKVVKSQILTYLASLSTDIKQESIKIPAKFQILIDPAQIKSQFNISVELNDETGVATFTGPANKIKEAITFARTSSKEFSVDSLDISKSHGKNLNHAKNLVLYLSKDDTTLLNQIKLDFPNVKVSLPKPTTLLTSKDVVINISAKTEFINEIKGARKDLISLVNSITPLDTLTIDDLDYDLFHKDIKRSLSASSDVVGFIQLGDYYPTDDHIILFAVSSTEDFKPSADEIQSSLMNINSILDPLRKKQEALTIETFELSSDLQSTYLSKDSVTYNLILDEVNSIEGNNIQIKLNKPVENEVYLRGNEKAVKLVSAALKSIIENPSIKSTLSFEIPSNSVARLIGNKGSNLQNLSEKFNCHIDVQDHDSNATVNLTGLEYNINRAKIYIIAEAKKWANIITKELIVPTKYLRSLSGKDFSYRNRLQDKYNVNIFFPKNGETLVIIRGPTRGVTKAYEELKALLDFEMENGHQTIVNVPVAQVALLIGKNGDHINDIRAEHGVQLNFLQKANNEKAKEAGFVELEITGSRQAIKDASKEIQDYINENGDFIAETLDLDRKYYRHIVGPNASTLKAMLQKAGGDEIKRKNVDIPNSDSDSSTITIEGPEKFVNSIKESIKKVCQDVDNSITKEIDIPSDRFGALVGPGGITRNNLETEFNVTIDIPDKNDTQGKVKIIGLSENIAKAEKKILSEIIRDSFDREIQVPAEYHEFVSERGSFMQKLRSEFSVFVRHGNTNRRANQINRKKIVIPETARGEPTQESNTTKLTLEQYDNSSMDDNEPITWRLNYENIDLSYLDADDVEPKKNVDSEAKKEENLNKAIKLIEDRIELAKEATTVGYLWASNSRNFNKVVGAGGSGVRKIKDSTYTIIHVPRKNDDINDVIYIRGSKDAVEKAAEIITKNLK
ncbi:hypothetical protein TBLA_0C02770 [Henningerozyma blattae CBS 6284]|uniref:K Homology domain-containing protein n=1 Tax=Henningerozyma blattae (strain ATCC 34711 / CBS 6284 / DSM 70876 / NBRC 10599 / NRRL Y-10934 / UCD 77-7) TaxID=1071380 RepID=I2H132_HENB6|nr:hypothetical protein TBLA_0C02770 [Tetrapisispora blattae CBS 6284]CCH60084.1 hypothetical protein TBLA_0C02770 [Tetrapisispora blattae CBS 6284]